MFFITVTAKLPVRAAITTAATTAAPGPGVAPASCSYLFLLLLFLSSAGHRTASPGFCWGRRGTNIPEPGAATGSGAGAGGAHTSAPRSYFCSSDCSYFSSYFYYNSQEAAPSTEPIYQNLPLLEKLQLQESEILQDDTVEGLATGLLSRLLVGPFNDWLVWA